MRLGCPAITFSDEEGAGIDPILPLDGGHILASVAGLVAGRNGRVAARVFSIVLTVVIGLWALFAGQWWILILGVVLTLANVQGLRAEMTAV